MTTSTVGQLIVSGISGTTLTPDEKEFIEKEGIGGIILFSKNYQSPDQLAELINSIQTLRQEYPLFIMVDQEGGRVIRFKTDFTQFPAMLKIGETDSPKLCFEAHAIMATELAACGVNVNLAPCCDIFSNPANTVIGDRAFGKDPEIVEKFVSSAIRGLQNNGVLACAKHFPGHGDTTLDSHYALPRITHTIEELRSREWIPFSKALRSRVELVMMAHIVVDAIDPKLPCTLSPHAYDILRKEFKYQKIIISDDMQMKAITEGHGVEEAAVMCLDAGADMLMYRDLDQARRALNGIKEACKTMRLKNEVMSSKITRVEACRKEHFAEYQPSYIPKAKEVVGKRAHAVFLQDLNNKIASGKAH